MKSYIFPAVFGLAITLASCGGSDRNQPAPDVRSSTAPSTSTSASSSTRNDAASIAQNWYTYTSKDGNNYSAKFPAQPREQDQSTNSRLGALKFILVIHEDKSKERAYLTSSVKYPVKPSQYNVEKGLDGARDGQAKGTNSTIINEKKITLNGLPGREITMRRDKGLATLTRIFIDPKGPTLYQAQVLALDGNVSFPEAQAFLDSFNVSK